MLNRKKVTDGQTQNFRSVTPFPKIFFVIYEKIVIFSETASENATKFLLLDMCFILLVDCRVDQIDQKDTFIASVVVKGKFVTKKIPVPFETTL